MAQVTRSRNIEIVEDYTALAAQIPLSANPIHHTHTPALAEVNNAMASNHLPKDEDGVILSELKSLKAAYRSAIGVAKRGRKPKIKKTNTSEAQEESASGSGSYEVPAENLGTVAVAPITEEPRQTSQKQKENSKVIEVEQVREPVYTGRTTRHQAAMAQAAEETLLKSQITRELQAAAKTSPGVSANCVTIVEPIETIAHSEARAPAKSPVKTLKEVENDCQSVEATPRVVDASEDSFVEQIISRSPAKLVSRIEDSVEALDEFEEALDALDQATLAESMAERMVSPPEKKHHSRVRRDSLELVERHRAEAEAKLSGRQAGGRTLSTKASSASMRIKSSTPKYASVLKKAASMTFRPTPESVKAQHQMRAPIKRPTSLMPPKEPSKSARSTRSTFELPGDAVPRKLKEQREARLAQRESSEDSHQISRSVSSPKVKSTKQLTKPSFELPGEALSRRKREANEARLKAQEEEERKRREFKATPFRKSAAPNVMPRDTVASRARQQKPDVDNIEDSKLSVAKRGSNVGAHRPSLMELNRANSSAARAAVPPPVRKSSPTIHGPSMSGRAMQRTVSVADVQHQRQRAREIYNRDAKMTEEMERERREREAAAKRAREEAAERGRQASREWAEKQMAKRAQEGDKGMIAGYGPGGQLGLRG